MTAVFSSLEQVASGARAVDLKLKRSALSPAPASDEILIARVAAADRSALRILCARHQTALYRFVLRIVRDASLAEDILSETFLAMWRQAAEFRGQSSVATWLMSIARFKAISARRRRTECELDVTMAERIVDPGDDPEVLLLKKSRAEQLREALSALSPEHAEVIDLVYYHGKSVTEVAQIAGIPEATVKTRMFYARKRLAQLVSAA
ncbi:MAG: sigma-70 family RNA polymerase sigma factor [Xanthobacteraceae bacterium]